MLNKRKGSHSLRRFVTTIFFSVLIVFAISTLIYLCKLSTLFPTLYPGCYQYPNPEKPKHTTTKESKTQDRDIIAVKSSFKVAIGTVVCHEPNNLSPREEALVLLKSTIISAIIYQAFPIRIDFHLFLEQESDQEYFLQNIKSLVESDYAIDVHVHFYSVFEVVPQEYLHLLLETASRCTYVRIFFPRALPAVDSILYLDTDVIITGDLAEIWDQFYEMDDTQFVGAVIDIEPDNKPWLGPYKASFENIPVPTVRGVNAGVLLMNLSKMREYKFDNKIMKLYKDYSIIKTDQTLLNALLFYNPYLLYLLPCQYNFRPPACSLGFYCGDALDDPTGIQIMHQYTKPIYVNLDNAFRDIAEAYQETTEPNIDFRTVLLIKVRNMYKDEFLTAYPHGQCNGVLNNLLFKRFFLKTTEVKNN